MGTPATTLKKFIKDENGNRIGVIVAGISEKDSLLRVGWSLINNSHPEHPDVYDNYRAHEIAYGRVDKQSTRIVPQRIKDEVIHMATRAGAYFKLDNVLISGIIVDDLAEYRKQLHKVTQ